MQIGGIIRAQMARKKLHQKDLARLLSVDQRTISNYCTNKTFPDLETLAQLCEILELDIRCVLDTHAHNCDHLMVQNDFEMRLLDAFRDIPNENQKAFLESFMTLAGMMKD